MNKISKVAAYKLHVQKSVTFLYTINRISENKGTGESLNFLDWKTQYCKNVHTTQNNLQIQGNPYQITNRIFTGLKQNFNLYGNRKHPENQKQI